MHIISSSTASLTKNGNLCSTFPLNGILLHWLLLARTYSVNGWVIPALYELCLRSVPLTLDESRQMDIEDVVLVTTVREDIHNHALQVNAAETPRHVDRQGTLSL